MVRLALSTLALGAVVAISQVPAAQAHDRGTCRFHCATIGHTHTHKHVHARTGYGSAHVGAAHVGVVVHVPVVRHRVVHVPVVRRKRVRAAHGPVHLPGRTRYCRKHLERHGHVRIRRCVHVRNDLVGRW